MKRKIIIVDHREEGFEKEKNALSKQDADLLIHQCMDENELIEKVRDAFIIIFTSSKFTRKVISQLSGCKMIIRYGSGLDNVDIKAASEKGIYVCNTQNYGSFAVAEHAFALLLAINRKLILLDRNVRNHKWDMESIVPVHSLRHKILGIAGFGKIGRQVCKMATAFDMKVIVYDPFIKQDLLDEYNVQTYSFDDFIINSDHITLHIPLTDKTQHLFNSTVFEKMKSTATIINTGRGNLINQNDLIAALRSGKIAGAGLDVFDNEPLELQNELLMMNNTVLSPHLAWYTEESIENLHQEVIDEVLRVLDGDIPRNLVN
jgi:D-3-phosphoglycerate dehydrogenase / 2-oxoglutarate reductase